MRRFCLYFLVVMLMGAGLSFAEPDLNASVREVLLKQLSFTGNYSVSFFGLNGENYGLVTYSFAVTNGTGTNSTNFTKTEEIFALNVTAEGVRLIVNETELDSILRARNLWLLTDLLQEIRGDVLVFNQSRELEARCKTSLGLDRALCWDADSCLYRSCVYSQAVCLPFAQGNGKPFLEAMASFSKATVEMDMGLGELMKTLDLFMEKKSDVLPKDSVIPNIEAQVALIGNNALFKAYSTTTNGFEFCSPIPYRSDALTSAKSKLAQLKAKLSSDAAINYTRGRIMFETLSRITAIEIANNASRTLLNEIKANATAEVTSTYMTIGNASRIITGETMDERASYLNQTLGRILKMDNVSAARAEYLALVNESRNTKDVVAQYVAEADELVKLSNECSAIITDAELKVKNQANKIRLEDLKARKENLDSLMGPPINEKDLVSTKAGLNSIKNQIGAIIIEEGTPESTGPDYVMIGGIVLALALIGIVYWLFSSGKLPLGRKKPPTGINPGQVIEAKPAEQPAMPLASATSTEVATAPPVRTATAPVARYRVKLALRGGAYRTKIKSAVKDKNGNLVPDGTTVAFKADNGAITPSAVTKGGTAYASMVFKQKPVNVTISVTAVGITRSIRIDFV